MRACVSVSSVSPKLQVIMALRSAANILSGAAAFERRQEYIREMPSVSKNYSVGGAVIGRVG